MLNDSPKRNLRHQPEKPLTFLLAVSSRLGDFSAQQTALMMKAALAAELGDEFGVKEAKDLEAQLMCVYDGWLSVR
jgi:hypothetical protein